MSGVCSHWMKKPVAETPSVQSLDRGLTILKAVARSGEPVRIGQLRELLGINRSSVFRLANTLRRRGFLSTPNGRNEYVIGPSIWRLFQNHDWSTLITFSRPHLKQLAAQTGETAVSHSGKSPCYGEPGWATARLIDFGDGVSPKKLSSCVFDGIFDSR